MLYMTVDAERTGVLHNFKSAPYILQPTFAALFTYIEHKISYLAIHKAQMLFRVPFSCFVKT